MSGVGSAALAVEMEESFDMQDGEEIHFETEQHTPIFQVHDLLVLSCLPARFKVRWPLPVAHLPHCCEDGACVTTTL